VIAAAGGVGTDKHPSSLYLAFPAAEAVIACTGRPASPPPG
jgi:hypothetical protein